MVSSKTEVSCSSICHLQYTGYSIASPAATLTLWDCALLAAAVSIPAKNCAQNTKTAHKNKPFFLI
jgi:hypothetical protein